MKKLFAIFVISISFVNYMNCQNFDDANKEIFLDGEFFLLEEDYIDALGFYQRLYDRKFDKNANINYRIGICYLNIAGQKSKAIPYLEKATEKVDESYKEGVFKQDKAPYDAFLFLGNAYRIDNQLIMAMDAYEKYQAFLTEKQIEERNYANQQIDACLMAQEMMDNPVDVDFKNVGAPINTETSNYNPVLSADGNTMIFMSERPFYHAIHYSTKENGRWTDPVNITPQIKSDGDLFTRSISANGKTLFMTKEDAFNSDIWVSTVSGKNRWSAAVPLSRAINTKYWESHAFLSADEKTLYFSSNLDGGSGLMDIYKITFNEALNDWSNPQNISIVNTGLNEECPTFTPDGNTMYFSSQDHNGMGGYDIFYSKKDSVLGTWSIPVNVGYPINTTDDEMVFYPVSNTGIQGYMARFSEDGYGKEDIYLVTVLDGKIEIEEDPKENVEELDTAVVETIAMVTDSSVIIEEPEPIKEVFEMVTIEVKPLFFGFNSTELTPQAKSQLDIFIGILNKHPDLNIELNGYTDIKGNNEINRIVATQRALAGKQYLIENGVSFKRIAINGYGNVNFIALNANARGADLPQGRMYNRRVEIRTTNLPDRYTFKQVVNIPEHLLDSKYNPDYE